jgi:SAM-dependent methyltransferase
VNRDEEEVRHRIAAAYDRIATGDAACCEPLNANAAAPPPAHHRKSAAVSCGYGSPVAISDLQPGDVVLDLGCGAGPDLLRTAAEVGPTGRVLGVDVSDAMIDRARLNVAAAGFDNVKVRKGIVEDLPVADESLDCVISNCVINLSPNTPRVFTEIARVLEPGRRMRGADVVADDLPEWVRCDLGRYASCIGGAISEHDCISGLHDAGLTDIALGGSYVYDRDQLAVIATEAQTLTVDPIRVADDSWDECGASTSPLPNPKRERKEKRGWLTDPTPPTQLQDEA